MNNQESLLHELEKTIAYIKTIADPFKYGEGLKDSFEAEERFTHILRSYLSKLQAERKISEFAVTRYHYRIEIKLRLVDQVFFHVFNVRHYYDNEHHSNNLQTIFDYC